MQGGLITKRMAAERGRGAAILLIVVGLFWLVLASIAAFDPPQDVLDWVLLVGRTALGIAFIVSGNRELSAGSKRIARFNAEHGESAGIQRS